MKKTLLMIACLGVFAISKGQFVKEYYKGTNPDTRFSAIIPVSDAPNSNLYIVGNYGSQLVVAETKQSGAILWSRRIIVNDPDYTVNSLIRDSDGNLVFCGGISTGVDDNSNGFVIKFNPLTYTLVWFHKTTALVSFFDVAEIGAGGNYAICGQEESNGTGNAADHIVMTCDRTTGSLSLISNLNQHINETAQTLVVDPAGPSIYTSGRYELNIGASKFRVCLTKMDVTGTVDFTKFSVKSLASTGRFYTEDMIIDGDNILMAGSGDDAGTSTFRYLFFYKTDLSGNLEWVKKYDITTTASDGIICSIKKHDTGYILYGVLNNETETNIFLINVDFDGNINWSKTYPYRKKQNPSGYYATSSLAVIGDHIFHVGEKLQEDGSIRGILMATTIETGDVGSCDEDLNTVMTTLVAPYEDDFTLQNATFTPSFLATSAVIKDQIFTTEVTCTNVLEREGSENQVGLLVEDYMLNIYPNPTHGIISIEILNYVNNDDQFQVNILDLLGRIVYQNDKYKLGENIDLTMITKGTYFIEVKDAQNNLSFGESIVIK